MDVWYIATLLKSATLGEQKLENRTKTTCWTEANMKLQLTIRYHLCGEIEISCGDFLRFLWRCLHMTQRKKITLWCELELEAEWRNVGSFFFRTRSGFHSDHILVCAGVARRKWILQSSYRSCLRRCNTFVYTYLLSQAYQCHLDDMMLILNCSLLFSIIHFQLKWWRLQNVLHCKKLRELKCTNRVVLFVLCTFLNIVTKNDPGC